MISDCLINCLQFLLIPSYALFFRVFRTRDDDGVEKEENNPRIILLSSAAARMQKELHFTLRFHVQLNFKIILNIPSLSQRARRSGQAAKYDNEVKNKSLMSGLR